MIQKIPKITFYVKKIKLTPVGVKYFEVTSGAKAQVKNAWTVIKS